MADSLLPETTDGIGAASFCMNESTPALSLRPIGVVHSPHGERVDAPRQPAAAASVEGTVELFAGHGYEDALCDLATWDHVWLVVWFDRNRGFRPKVTPPRSDKKRGVFATRSPYRPNPIGLSAVRLLGVDGLVLHVRGLDLLDQTPLLDLKPYVPYTDAIPEANHGWLDPARLSVRNNDVKAGVRPLDPIPQRVVTFAPLAAEQLAWLRGEHEVALAERIESQLALGVAPHAYRRIKRDGDSSRLAIKDWRAWFRVDGGNVTVERIGSGYRPRELYGPEGHAPAAHRAFAARWPG
jgi:tRNA-Thr(GGU) m(6)t(6)A37 methyltransferase TsaA